MGQSVFPVPSTLTTKGDLLAYDTAPNRLPVGADGTTLVANSASATGMAWAGPTVTAGKNAVINGGMDIWQRSTSTSGSGYTCVDRFYVYGSGTSTFSRESSVVPTGLQYSFKHLAGATTASSLAQVIETSNAILYAGQTVTLSMYASASTATTMSFNLDYSTGVDTAITGSWTSISPSGASTFAAGTSGAFTRGQAIFAVPSTAKSLRATVSVNGTIANTVAVYYAGVQLELGSVATPFTTATGTVQGELAACQRYYFRKKTGVSNAGNLWESDAIGNGYHLAGSDFRIFPSLPAQMRTIPSISFSGALKAGNYGGQTIISTITSFTQTSVPNTLQLVCGLSGTFAGTAGSAGSVGNTSTTVDAYVEYNSEL